ncbi:MAG: hypothetical protein KGM47_04635 [Acidobacteriota bacterium]|nr:hypothetical protein [Acidobacteriota bacterium]
MSKIHSVGILHSMQDHLRKVVRGIGQVETDEVYIGVDKKGVQYIFPVQAKGGRDRLSVVQIEQDIAVCAAKFPALVCRPMVAQFMAGISSRCSNSKVVPRASRSPPKGIAYSCRLTK